MALTITADRIISDQTGHAASLTDGGWVVSWLPERPLKKSQAISAMEIADAAGRVSPLDWDEDTWVHVAGWAAELGLGAAHAAALASEPARDDD